MSEDIDRFVRELAEFMPGFAGYWTSGVASCNFGNAPTVHGVFSDFSALVIGRLVPLENGVVRLMELQRLCCSGGVRRRPDSRQS